MGRGDSGGAVIMTASEVAGMLRISCQTLEVMRLGGRGPRYIRLGREGVGRVVYLLSDVEAWLERYSVQ